MSASLSPFHLPWTLRIAGSRLECPTVAAMPPALVGSSFEVVAENVEEPAAALLHGICEPDACERLAQAIAAEVPAALRSLLDAHALGSTPGRVPPEHPAGVTVLAQLPFFERKEWANRSELLAGAAATASALGQIWISAPAANASKRVLSLPAAALQSCATERLPFSFSACWSTHAANWTRFLKLYEFAPKIEGKLLAHLRSTQNCPAELILLLPEQECASALLPSPELPPSDSVLKLSQVIQRTLRVWLSFVWTRDLAREVEPVEMEAVLLYGSSLPSPAHSSVPTLDPLSEETVQRVYISAGRRMVTELESLIEPLAGLGKPALRQFYRATKDGLEFQDTNRNRTKRRRFLTNILVVEAICLDSF